MANSQLCITIFNNYYVLTSYTNCLCIEFPLHAGSSDITDRSELASLPCIATLFGAWFDFTSFISLVTTNFDEFTGACDDMKINKTGIVTLKLGSTATRLRQPILSMRIKYSYAPFQRNYNFDFLTLIFRGLVSTCTSHYSLRYSTSREENLDFIIFFFWTLSCNFTIFVRKRRCIVPFGMSASIIKLCLCHMLLKNLPLAFFCGAEFCYLFSTRRTDAHVHFSLSVIQF